MTKIYSYVLRIDDGAAPNPFWQLCTLTICKPAIRKNAQVNDWVIGTGSKNVKLNDGKYYDFSESLVYAMKITDIMTLNEYDSFCQTSLLNKIPKWKTKDWQLKVGDCIYDYSNGNEPIIRKGVHNEENRKRDLSGNNALLSNHFFYFGVEAIPIPLELKDLIKKNQGHKKIENIHLIEMFQQWISQFEKNRLYADPQMRWLFDREVTEKELSACAKQDFCNDEDETEETVC
ncbi:hypothetical protein A4H97_34140 [Niastella yeongjuensis]|uniref:Nucleotide modification associated domain-containing protein n=1 Tax=Niastella yeongjuensis TaxID=354355 RepID=A0A1V9E7E8_9BACT|nr:hypothetical protein [Niastella yeongjuensis]OQP42029.1 hypothetical protein A4H97_34140 [Niastella yeongjuensis]SEP49203.1 hypothetical protein SAMN05660816_06907 [Niastella yeongjuensis]